MSFYIVWSDRKHAKFRDADTLSLVTTASNSFEIRPNGTTPAQVTANTNADPSNSATQAATGSATATLSSASSTGTTHNSNTNGAMGVVKGSTAAVVGSLASVVLGVGVGLLA